MNFLKLIFPRLKHLIFFSDDFCVNLRNNYGCLCCLCDGMNLKFCEVIATIPKRVLKTKKMVNFPIGLILREEK